MTTIENKQVELGEGLADMIKANFRREIINIIKTAPEYNEEDEETQQFINEWVEDAWSEFTQQPTGIKLKKVDGSDNIW